MSQEKLNEILLQLNDAQIEIDRLTESNDTYREANLHLRRENKLLKQSIASIRRSDA